MSPKRKPSDIPSTSLSILNPRRSQPKSSRQQYSACGCCRIRRVRCDLKDLAAESNGIRPLSCSNCKERGIKCVYVSTPPPLFLAPIRDVVSSDEFAEVKNVKILRRGRRILEAEKEFGKITSNDLFASCKSCSEIEMGKNSIPVLTIDFFASNFYNRFTMQRTSTLEFN